jgi:hypothetical protein
VSPLFASVVSVSASPPPALLELFDFLSTDGGHARS